MIDNLILLILAVALASLGVGLAGDLLGYDWWDKVGASLAILSGALSLLLLVVSVSKILS